AAPKERLRVAMLLKWTALLLADAERRHVDVRRPRVPGDVPGCRGVALEVPPDPQLVAVDVLQGGGEEPVAADVDRLVVLGGPNLEVDDLVALHGERDGMVLRVVAGVMAGLGLDGRAGRGRGKRDGGDDRGDEEKHALGHGRDPTTPRGGT